MWGKQIRADMWTSATAHDPALDDGEFSYAQGVEDQVLSSHEARRTKGNTQEVWVYDLRTKARSCGTRTQLTRE